jgi:regulatory protein
MLARREFARAELAERLVAKGASRAEVAVVLDELSALGYVSDQRYARAYALQKAGRCSRQRIASELRSKGVDADDIAAALTAAGTEDAATLESLWRRRFGTPPANDRDKARQVRFLQSRGFPLSAIFALLRKVPR